MELKAMRAVLVILHKALVFNLNVKQQVVDTVVMKMLQVVMGVLAVDQDRRP
jgi:hypothetical protein